MHAPIKGYCILSQIRLYINNADDVNIDCVHLGLFRMQES